MSLQPTAEQQAETDRLNEQFGSVPVVRNLLFELGGPLPIDFATEQDGPTTFVWPRYQQTDGLGQALRSKTAMRFKSPEEAGTFNTAIMRILQNMIARSAKGQ